MLGDPLVVGFTFLLGVMAPFLAVWAIARRRKAAGKEVPRPLRIAVKLLGILFVLGAPLTIVAMGIGPTIQGERRHDELVKTGKRATATINAIQETGTVINRRPEVRVWMTVTPEGVRPFQSQETWAFSVSDIQSYKTGTTVNVFFDPADHGSVAIVGVARKQDGG